MKRKMEASVRDAHRDAHTFNQSCDEGASSHKHQQCACKHYHSLPLLLKRGRIWLLPSAAVVLPSCCTAATRRAAAETRSRAEVERLKIRYATLASARSSKSHPTPCCHCQHHHRRHTPRQARQKHCPRPESLCPSPPRHTHVH